MNGVPLWADGNDSLSSAIFEVPAGKVGVLFGLNFGDEIERTAGAFRTEQTACIHKVYLAQSEIERQLACGEVLTLDSVKAFSYVDEQVLTCDGPWQLTNCRNMAIIGVPGVYYLELNGRSTSDESPQVYFELWNKDDIAPQVTGIVFQ